MKRFVLDEKHLEPLLEEIERSGRSIILLEGDLGAGKTTLVKNFAKRRKYEGVSSPTFSLQHRYGEDIYHYDLYRGGFEKFMELGLFEELEKPGIHFIEWAGPELEEFLRSSGFSYLKITIHPDTKKRIYEVEYA